MEVDSTMVEEVNPTEVAVEEDTTMEAAAEAAGRLTT